MSRRGTIVWCVLVGLVVASVCWAASRLPVVDYGGRVVEAEEVRAQGIVFASGLCIHDEDRMAVVLSAVEGNGGLSLSDARGETRLVFMITSEPMMVLTRADGTRKAILLDQLPGVELPKE